MAILPKPLAPEQARMKNPLSLAFVGDTVWDLLVRQRLLLSQAHVNALHRQAQAAALVEPCLTPEESDVFRRGQNAHARHNAPKNQDPVAYSRATGLEALLGYLYLTGQEERILQLFEMTIPKGGSPNA